MAALHYEWIALECSNWVLTPDVGFLVGIEGKFGAVDGYVATKGELSVAHRGRWHGAEEGDILQGLVTSKGIAADSGDIGGNKIVGDGGTVEEGTFGNLCQTMRDDKMAHIRAIEEGKSTQLNYGMGHHDIDQRHTILESILTNGGEGLGHVDDAEVGTGVKSIVANVEHGGRQFDALDADAVGKSTVANTGDYVVLPFILDGTRHFDIATQHLRILKIRADAYLAVIDDLVVQHLTCGAYRGEVGLNLLGKGCREARQG